MKWPKRSINFVYIFLVSRLVGWSVGQSVGLVKFIDSGGVLVGNLQIASVRGHLSVLDPFRD